jgi:hypothetical protein
MIRKRSVLTCGIPSVKIGETSVFWFLFGTDLWVCLPLPVLFLVVVIMSTVGICHPFQRRFFIPKEKILWKTRTKMHKIKKNQQLKMNGNKKTSSDFRNSIHFSITFWGWSPSLAFLLVNNIKDERNFFRSLFFFYNSHINSRI